MWVRVDVEAQMWCVPAGLTVAEAPQQDFFHTPVGAAANRTCSRLPRTWSSADITQGWPRVPAQPSSVISTLRVKLRLLQLAAFRWKTEALSVSVTAKVQTSKTRKHLNKLNNKLPWKATQQHSTSLAVINRDASEQRLIVYRTGVWGRTSVWMLYTGRFFSWKTAFRVRTRTNTHQGHFKWHRTIWRWTDQPIPTNQPKRGAMFSID